MLYCVSIATVQYVDIVTSEHMVVIQLLREVGSSFDQRGCVADLMMLTSGITNTGPPGIKYHHLSRR